MSILSAKLRILEGDRASVAAGGVPRVPGSTLLVVWCASRAPFDELKHTLKECFPHTPFAKFTTWISSTLTRYWTKATSEECVDAEQKA